MDKHAKTHKFIQGGLASCKNRQYESSRGGIGMSQPTSHQQADRYASATQQMGKVAAVTLSFWLIKIIVTTVGDVSGDLLSITLGLGYVLALFVALAIVLVLTAVQIKAARFHAVLFWILVLATSALGAELSDTIDRALHLDYIVGAIVLLAGLLATLVVWCKLRGRLRIYPIHDQQEELFYWLAVVFSNSLGSVLGDFVGDRFGLGAVGGIAVNAAILAVLLALYHTRRVNQPALFWIAFVFSRA